MGVRGTTRTPKGQLRGLAVRLRPQSIELHRDRPALHARSIVTDVDVAQPVLLIGLRKIGPMMSAAAIFARERALSDQRRCREQVSPIERLLPAEIQADSAWNVIRNPAFTLNDGRTLLPTQYWSVADGPLKYPVLDPFQPRITVNGVNYVQE